MGLIPPPLTWCVQIDVTSRCVRKCSNCTRMCGLRETESMTPEEFRTAVRSVADFPAESPPAAYCREPKCIGMIGGDPLLHPQFEELCSIFMEEVPLREHRGLWTGIRVPSKYESIVDETFGYRNTNYHKPACMHQPILAASAELIPDDAEREKWISECWVNHYWSPIITRQGAYFCEVAATISELYGLDLAKPVEPGWWRRPMEYFQDQADACCRRCGCAIPLPVRRDDEETDDITPGNLEDLHAIGRCGDRKFEVFDPEGYDPETYLDGWMPRRYMR
jgi:hypothetical protein